MKKHIEKARRFIVGKFIKYQDKRIIKTALADLRTRHPQSLIDSYFKPLLVTALTQARQEMLFSNERVTGKGHKIVFGLNMAVTKIVIEKLWTLHGVIGIQPMHGPVGLIYALRFQDLEGGKLRLDIISTAVTAGTRRLSAGFSLNAVQDLATMHGVDLEEELTEALGSEIFYEIVNEIMANLTALATKGTEKPIVVNRELLMIGINKASNEIASTTRRGCGNVIITSPIGLVELQMSLGSWFRFEPSNKPKSFEFFHAGDIMSTDLQYTTPIYSVYVTLAPSISGEETSFIVGYKGGSGETDCGYFYCPYVVLLKMGIVVDENSFEPIMQLATRYGTTTGYDVDKIHYYRKVTLKD